MLQSKKIIKNAGVTDMDKQRIDMWIMHNSKYFPEDKMIYIRERLENMEDEQFARLSTIQFKDPTTMLIVSILLGGYGIDRFMLGDVGMGILKLLTGGLCGILAIYDWCTIMKKARELNFEKIIAVL